MFAEIVIGPGACDSVLARVEDSRGRLVFAALGFGSDAEHDAVKAARAYCGEHRLIVTLVRRDDRSVAA